MYFYYVPENFANIIHNLDSFYVEMGSSSSVKMA